MEGWQGKNTKGKRQKWARENQQEYKYANEKATQMFNQQLTAVLHGLSI